MSNTLCNNHQKHNPSQKADLCLTCPVFKACAEADPRGWSHFVSEELRYLVQDDRLQSLQKQESLIQALGSVPTGLFTTDEKGRINYFNAAAERITGLLAADAVGMRCEDVFGGPACENNCPSVQASRTARNTENGEYLFNRPEAIPVACSSLPLRDRFGRVMGRVWVFKDVSTRKRLEKSLQDSQRKLSTLISSLPGIAYRRLNDQDWTVEFVSDGCVEFLGYTPSDLIGNRVASYNELIHPDDQEHVQEQIWEAMREKRPFQVEYRIRTWDGQQKWVWDQGRGVFGDNGELLALEGLITEITERKQLEDELKASERKYRRFFEGSRDMIFITSKEGKIKDINQAGVDLLKYHNKQDLLSLESIEEIYDNLMHWKVFQKQIDRHGFVKDFEGRFRKKDGTCVHCLLSGNAVRGADGEIIGYEGIAKDITAREDASRNLAQRHQELRFLHSVALAMNKTRNLDEILMTTLKNVLEALNLSSGGIFIIDHEKSDFELRVQVGLPLNEENWANQIVLSDKPLMRSLLKKDISFTPNAHFPPFKAILKAAGDVNPIQLTCFLITAKEKASGFLALDIPENRNIREGQDAHLLGSLGNFLGGAIENARLLETVHKHREELEGLTAELFHSQEEERKRIAQELHDEAGQALTGINFTLETIERNLPSELKGLLSDVRKQINCTYEDMRRLSHRLHPLLLSDMGLEPALDSYLRGISRHTDLEISFKMVGFEDRVDPEIETVLYRLAQEAVTNVLRHSLARNLKLSIIKSYPRIIFMVEDDGIGFDLNHVGKNGHTLGLLGMRERAAILGGRFSLRTSKGKGTRIRIEIPIRSNRE